MIGLARRISDACEGVAPRKDAVLAELVRHVGSAGTGSAGSTRKTRARVRARPGLPAGGLGPQVPALAVRRDPTLALPEIFGVGVGLSFLTVAATAGAGASTPLEAAVKTASDRASPAINSRAG